MQLFFAFTSDADRVLGSLLGWLLDCARDLPLSTMHVLIYVNLPSARRTVWSCSMATRFSSPFSQSEWTKDSQGGCSTQLVLRLKLRNYTIILYIIFYLNIAVSDGRIHLRHRAHCLSRPPASSDPEGSHND
jgi:hypothetical protein